MYAAGRPIAQVAFDVESQAEDVTYLYTDHQGSVRLTTNAAGSAVRGQTYGPFGQPVDATGEATEALSDVHFGYTGHEHDTELGLINMRGRMYDPALRGFLTPDPIIPDAFDPESYNPYAYVRNNPTRFVDPSGFELVVTDPWAACGSTACDPIYLSPAAAHGMSEEEWGNQVDNAKQSLEHVQKLASEGYAGFEGGVSSSDMVAQARARVDALLFTPTAANFSTGTSTPTSESSPGPSLSDPSHSGQFAIVSWNHEFGPTKRAADFIQRVANGEPASDAWSDSGLTSWDVALAVMPVVGAMIGNVVSKMRDAARAATTLSRDVDLLAQYGARVPTQSGGFFNVVTHANPDTAAVLSGGKWLDVSHRSLATFIRGAPGYAGQPVRLIGCSAGACSTGLAKNLANKLGVDVLAPTADVFVTQTGSFWTSGTWRLFTPGVP